MFGHHGHVNCLARFFDYQQPGLRADSFSIVSVFEESDNGRCNGPRLL